MTVARRRKADRPLGEFPETQTASWIKFLIQVLLLPAIVYLLYTSAEIQQEIVRMQAQMWTTTDQAAHAREVWDAINNRPLRSENPPQWFLERMDSLQRAVEANTTLLNQHIRDSRD